MRRVRYHAHGGPEVLAVEEAEVPSPGPRQVLIRTEAIGVNYVDVQLRRATDPASLYYRQLPATLTGDVVGTVEAVGPGTDPSLAGTRVAVLLEDAYADYVLAGTDWLVPVPPQLRLEAGQSLRRSQRADVLQQSRVTQPGSEDHDVIAGRAGELREQGVVGSLPGERTLGD